MRLSFSYSGRLLDAKTLPQFVHEVEDICNTLGWECTIYKSAFPDHQFVNPANDQAYGLTFKPKGCDSVSLVFDSEGRIYNYFFKDMIQKHQSGEVKVITVKLNLDDDNSKPEISEELKPIDINKMVYQVSVNLQDEDTGLYINVLELIRYLSEKYLTDFELNDDCEYWTTRNPEKLTGKLKEINMFMDTFKDFLSTENFNNPVEFIKFLQHFSRQFRHRSEED